MENEKNIFHQKSIEELTFTDDGMFQAVLHEPGICAELIERLLHVNVSHVEYPELEKQIAPYYSSKGVRLDVYLKDLNKIIDVEMQSYPQESLGKRTRYYQSMIDIDSLMKGQDYPELKDSYILFICKQDPFKDEENKKFGLPCYTFRNICEENSSVKLCDNTLKMIYNSSAYEKVEDKRIRSLLKFVYTNEPGKDDFSNRLSSLVEKLKDNEEFRSTYNAMNLHDRDIIRATRKEAFAEGCNQKSLETAENLFKMNVLSPEQISQASGLPLEQVLELQKKLTVTA